jgi:hypothetical protein
MFSAMALALAALLFLASAFGKSYHILLGPTHQNLQLIEENKGIHLLIPKDIDIKLYAYRKKKDEGPYSSTLLIHVWTWGPVTFGIFAFKSVSHIF